MSRNLIFTHLENEYKNAILRTIRAYNILDLANQGYEIYRSKVRHTLEECHKDIIKDKEEKNTFGQNTGYDEEIYSSQAEIKKWEEELKKIGYCANDIQDLYNEVCDEYRKDRDEETKIINKFFKD